MKTVRLLLAFKDFSYWTAASSVGLHVAALTTAEVLREAGIDAEAIPVLHNIGLFDAIRHRKPTHVVIMAPWISVLDLDALVTFFPDVQFAVQSHCNVGGLHGDPRGIANIRGYANLTFSLSNLRLAGNSPGFTDWLREVYDTHAVLLPNLYPAVMSPSRARHIPGQPLRIGAFGALRPEKNFITATAAALLLQKTADSATELHLSAGGEVGHDAKEILSTIRQMTEGVPGFTLIAHRWADWKAFRKLVGSMHLLLQPSFTESFNMVTADGVVEGVPSVVSSAISWAPESWRANSDSAVDIARVGLRLLRDGSAPEAGLKALREHDRLGLRKWKNFLDIDPSGVLHYLSNLISS